MSNNEIDNFLQESCMTIHDLWFKVNKKELTTEQLYELNDVLDEFFERITSETL